MIGLIILLASLALVYWLFLSPTSQVFGSFPSSVKTDQKVVALTFDDGPNQPYTGQLLKLLDQKGVKATFFVVGANLKRHPDVIKSALAAGHTVANHSEKHQFRRYFTSRDFQTEIAASQASIQAVTGRTPALFRPPWLFRTPLILRRARLSGLTPVSGKFTNSWEIFQPSAKRIARSAWRQVKPGAILIFHDGYNAKGGRRDQTIAAVGQIIDAGRAQGYDFTTVDQLLGIPAYQT